MRGHATNNSSSSFSSSAPITSYTTMRNEKRSYDVQLTDLNAVETNITAPHRAGPRLYGDDGLLILQPAPTKDPRDPLNLTFGRKWCAVAFLSIFGALVSSAELILGSMLPVFVLVYAHIDPKIIKTVSDAGGLPRGQDPIKYLSALPNVPPIWKVYLLASMPVLVIGLSNLFLIPLAISVGRRPVILATGIIGIAGAIWAGNSQSLESHIAARCVQAIGAGTIESLIPFIVQDMVYVHQRNSWMSIVFAAQGILIIGLGIAAPYIIIYLDWRWVYFITAIAAAFFLILVFIFLPETRWHRTRAEMDGIPAEDTRSIHDLPPRTLRSNFVFQSGPLEWRKGFTAFVDTLKTFFYPHIFFITMLNSAMIACAFAAGYTVAPALLTNPWSWPFLHLGLCLIPVLIAAILAGVITGALADKLANLAARKRGARVPENQLLNLILPTTAALVGCIIFGVAGQNIDSYSWEIFLFALGLMAFGFLGANTVGAVYVLECYPHLAGPALVNIASFRCIIAFALSFKVSEWILEFGYFKSFMIYTGAVGSLALCIPIVYVFGPAWRRRWPGRLRDE